MVIAQLINIYVYGASVFVVRKNKKNSVVQPIPSNS